MPAAADQLLRLSIVLVAGAQRRRAGRALRSLLAQEPSGGREIIFLDLAAPGLPPPPEAFRPGVRHLRLPPETTLAEARAAGARLARAPLVAFLEEHCAARPGWARALEEAFAAGPWAGVGGEIATAAATTRRERALLALTVFNYWPWLQPAAPGERDYLPGHNSAYRREVLLARGGGLPRLLLSDTVLQQELRRAGQRLFLEPAARFVHPDESSFRDGLWGLILYQRCQGAALAASRGWPGAWRLILAGLAPLVAARRIARTLAALARRGRLARAGGLPLLPLLVLQQGLATLGWAFGLAAGWGCAPRLFTAHELEGRRILDDRDDLA